MDKTVFIKIKPEPEIEENEHSGARNYIVTFRDSQTVTIYTIGQLESVIS